MDHFPRRLTYIPFDGNFLDAGPLRAGGGRQAAPLGWSGHSSSCGSPSPAGRTPSGRRLPSRWGSGFDFGAPRQRLIGAGLGRAWGGAARPAEASRPLPLRIQRFLLGPLGLARHSKSSYVRARHAGSRRVRGRGRAGDGALLAWIPSLVET